MPSISARPSPVVLRALQGLALAVAAWIVFAPALQGGWIWDDYLEIVRHPALRTPGGWWHAWVAPEGSDYLPLSTTVQWLEWHLWGDSPLGYHLATLGLHIANALLVWRLLARLGLRSGAAWLGGLLFAVHPLAVESVAWIAEQKNTLSLALLLGAMLAWLEYDARANPASSANSTSAPSILPRSPSPRLPVSASLHLPYSFALALFAAALLAKASVVMLPCVLLLHTWWRRGRIVARDLLAVAPFFVVALGLGLITVHFQGQRAIGLETVALGSVFTRALRAGLLLAFYAGKTLWPAALLPVYPVTGYDSPAVLPALLAWLGAFGIAAVCVIRRASLAARTAGFALGAFALNLVPVLGLVSMAYHRIAWAADHFAYLSLVPAAGLAAAAYQWAGNHLSRSSLAPRAVAGGAALVLAASIVVARGDAAHFASEETLWTYTLAHNPDAWIGHNNLGQLLAASGHPAEAAEHFARAAALRPASPDAHYNLANAFLAAGRTREAIAEYERALALKPAAAEVHNNLANSLLQAGDLPAALAHYDEAVRLLPDFADAQANRARVLQRLGRATDALAAFQSAHRLAPASAPIARDLANLLADLNRASDALPLYREAVRLDPADAETHNNLGSLLAESGQLAEAQREFAEAVRLKPDFAAARENLAMIQQQIAEEKPGK